MVGQRIGHRPTGHHERTSSCFYAVPPVGPEMMVALDEYDLDCPVLERDHRGDGTHDEYNKPAF
jgi:hypothetical protein